MRSLQRDVAGGHFCDCSICGRKFSTHLCGEIGGMRKAASGRMGASCMFTLGSPRECITRLRERGHAAHCEPKCSTQQPDSKVFTCDGRRRAPVPRRRAYEQLRQLQPVQMREKNV